MKYRLSILAAALTMATTVSSQAGLKEDATEYGEKLAQDLFEHGERNQEAIYTREVTGANLYGYHSQGDIDAFVAVASHVAHEIGAELKAHKLKADADLALMKKGYMAAQEVEIKARNEMYPTPTYNGDLDAYAEKAKVEIGAPMYSLGIIDEVNKFFKAHEEGSMTAI
jgi:hypothetical protein